MEALGWLTVLLTIAVDEPRAPELHAIPILPTSTVETKASGEVRGLAASLESGDGVLTLTEVPPVPAKLDRSVKPAKDDGKPCANCQQRVMPRLSPVRMPLPSSGPPPESVPLPIAGPGRTTTKQPVTQSGAEIFGQTVEQVPASPQQQPAAPPRRGWFGKLFDNSGAVDAVPRYEENLRSGRRATTVPAPMQQQVVIREEPAPRQVPAQREMLAQREPTVQRHSAMKVARREEPAAEVAEDHGRLGGQLFGDSESVVSRESEPKSLSRSASAWTYSRPTESSELGKSLHDAAPVEAPLQAGLEGRVQKASINGGAWLLVVDGKPGSYVLTGDRRLSRLKAGDRVHVEGSFAAEQSNEYLGMPVYHVEKLMLLEFAGVSSGKTTR